MTFGEVVLAVFVATIIIPPLLALLIYILIALAAIVMGLFSWLVTGGE